jgi:hypothetical protein
MTAVRPGYVFAVTPDPGQARTLDELIERLRSLKVWAGDPSYEWITGRVNQAWTAAGRPAAELTKKATVVDCFKLGRRRLNTDLVIAVVQALHPDVGYVTHWRQALQVIGGETRAASQVRVQGNLPQDLAGFTGRTAELDRLCHALHRGTQHRGTVVTCAIAGMAGVGKTQLAIHAGHLLTREMPFDAVLFVNLRGFHPDPTQPPADPAAVLDGFLRQLGIAGQQVPHDLPARIITYRNRLAGTRTLVVLDNAATEDQVRPLLPQTPGCLTLITSRRSLTTLQADATHWHRLAGRSVNSDAAVTTGSHRYGLPIDGNRLWFAADRGEHPGGGWLEKIWFWTPVGDRDEPGFDQVPAGQQAMDLLWCAEVQGGRGALVQLSGTILLIESISTLDRGAVGEGEVAAGHHRVAEVGENLVGMSGLRQEVHHRVEQHG